MASKYLLTCPCCNGKQTISVDKNHSIVYCHYQGCGRQFIIQRGINTIYVLKIEQAYSVDESDVVVDENECSEWTETPELLGSSELPELIEEKMKYLERQAANLYRRLSGYYGDYYYNVSITRRERLRHAKERAFERWCRRSSKLGV